MTVPFVGPWYDALFTALVVLHLVLVAFALRRWFAGRTQGLRALVEAAAIVLVPVLGPTVYLMATADHSRRTPATR